MLPNVVIAGAPKCGTTSLFAWLNDHPEICGSSVKETRFLMDRGDCLFRKNANFHDHGLAGYEAYFSACGASAPTIVFEATPTYLYQRTAPEVLSSLDPAPRIVFVFRKPSERVYSHFHYLQGRARIDDSLDFRRFVDLVRDEDPSIPTANHANLAIAFSRYSDYVPFWLSRFPSDRFDFFLFENLRSDPRGFAKAVSRRLGVEPAFFDGYDFHSENRTFRVRSARAHRARRWAGRRVSPRTRERIKAVTAGAYGRLNVDSSSGGPTSDERTVLAELDADFEPYNERLASLTGLDLAAWA
jgi:Sulfotransferase domain